MFRLSNGWYLEKPRYPTWLCTQAERHYMGTQRADWEVSFSYNIHTGGGICNNCLARLGLLDELRLIGAMW